MSQQRKGPRLNIRGSDLMNYGLFVMTLTHLLTHVFTRVHTTLFPVLQIEFNLTLQQLALIAAIPPLCQTIPAIPIGLLADKIGSKKLLLASLVMSVAGAILASRASTPLMLIIAVSLAYVNTTVYHAPAYSFVTKLFKPRDRPRALGLHGAGGTLGVAIGPLSISLIMGVLGLGWRQVYLFWLIPFLLGLAAVLAIRSEPVEDAPMDQAEQAASPPVTSLLSTSLVMFLIFLSIRVVANTMTDSFLALYLVNDRGMAPSAASLVIGLNIAVGVVAAPLGGFWAVRFGEKRWLMTVYALAYVSYGLAFLAPTTGLLVALYLAYGVLTLLGMAANSAIMAKLSPGKKRGLAYALFFLPSSLVGAVAPFLAAAIAERFGMASIFAACTATYVLSLIMLKFGVKVRP